MTSKIVTTRDLVAEAVQTLRATLRPTLLIVMLGMIVPQTLLGLVVDAATSGVIGALRLRTDTAASGAGYQELIAPAIAFMLPVAGYLAAIMLGIMTCYFALVHLAVEYRRGALITAGSALWRGLKTTVPSGLVVLVCLVFLTMIGQVLVAPAVLIAVLSLIIPVILVAEGRGALPAVWRALTLRYARRSGVSGWAVLFVLLTLGAIFYTAVALIGMASQAILGFDQIVGVGRDLWAATLGDLAIGPVYILVTLFEVTTTMTLLALFPAVTAALYFNVAGVREIGSA